MVKKKLKRDLSVHQLKDNDKDSAIDSLNQQIMFLERHVEDMRNEITAQDLKIECARRDLYLITKKFKDLFKVIEVFLLKEDEKEKNK